MKYLLKTKLILLVLIFLISCNKNDDSNAFIPTLPLVTQTGENTFGCYIDGQLVTPRDGAVLITGTIKGLRFFGNEIVYSRIKVTDSKSENGGFIEIHIPELQEIITGSFEIKESSCQGTVINQTINSRCRVFNEQLQIFSWYCSIENSGTLTVSRYDFGNKIVSGTFSFSAVNQDNPNDIIEITEGRFDIKWNTLADTEFP